MPLIDPQNPPQAWLDCSPAPFTEGHLNRAQLAYHRYGHPVKFRNFLGNPIPNFEDLPEGIQCGWLAAANDDLQLLY